MSKMINVVDNKLPKRVNDFSKYLLTNNSSIKTIRGYQIDLSTFFKFMKSQRLNVESVEDISDINDEFINSITLSDLHNFMYFLEVEKKNVAGTRNRKRSTLVSFYEYLCDELEVIENNPTKKLKTAKMNKRQPNFLTLYESKQLLNSIDKKSNNGIRDYCIITILLNCGLRREEVSTLNINSIKEEVLTVIGKGDKERFIPLTPSCLRAIEEWLEVRKTTDKDEIALFSSQKGGRICPEAVWKLVVKHVRNCGINKEITTHGLRHTTASLLLDAGVDIRVIQEILGHSDISTTMLYLHLDKSSLINAMKINPLGDL